MEANTSSSDPVPVCPVSDAMCERNCEESPENPKLIGVCALSVPARPDPVASSLLGRQVKVTLTREDGVHRAVVARGQLLVHGAMGEVVVLGDDGDVHWCWPMLEVREREETVNPDEHAALASVSGPPEAEPPVRPWRKFNVTGSDDGSDDYAHRVLPLEIRCWVCGTAERFGGGGDAVGLEELTGWAAAHECARRLSVNGEERRDVFEH